jgi:hypothetical protein
MGMSAPTPDTGDGAMSADAGGDTPPRAPRKFPVKHAGLVLAMALAVAVGAIFNAAGGDSRRPRTTVLALALAQTGSVVIELAPVADGPPPSLRPESVDQPSPIPALPPSSDPDLPMPPMPAEAPLIPPVPEPPAGPLRQAMVVPRPPAAAPAIAVVIDDMGLDRARSRRAIALPGPLTMAVLPAPPGTR